MTRWICGVLLLAGLQFGTAVFAQAPANSGIVVTDTAGPVRYRIGEGEPQTLQKGQTIPVGARIATGTDSHVVLTFADGQIVVIGPQSRLVIRNFSYVANDLGKSSMLLNVTEGSILMSMGAIGQRDPSLIQVQVGTKNLEKAPVRAPGKDVGVIVLGIAAMVQAVQRVSLRVASPDQTFQLAAGVRALVQADGTVRTGPPSQVDPQAGQSADGKIMLSRMEGLQRYLPAGRQTAFFLSTPPSEDPVDGLDAAGEGPVTATAPTASTGASGSGCGASCN